MSTAGAGYRIQLPSIRWPESAALQEVAPWETMQRRKAVEKIGRYFRREFRYDFIPYSAHDPGDNEVAFLWLQEDWDWQGKRMVAYGACAFDQWADGWCLAWVWFHPYERGRGHLSEAWPYFQRRFGDFFLQEPISIGMHEFLRRRAETRSIRS